MRSFFTHPSASLLVLALFAVVTFLAPTSAEANWKSHNDEYPGLEDSDLTPYLIVGGLLVGGAILYRIVSHKSGDEKQVSDQGEAAQPAAEDDSESEGEAAQTDAGSEVSINPDQDSRLQLYFDVTSDDYRSGNGEPARDFSDLTVKVGVSFGF